MSESLVLIDNPMKGHGIFFVSKLSLSDRQLVWNLNRGNAIVDESFWKIDEDYNKMIDYFHKGICLNCGNSEDVKTLKKDSRFWGCNLCGYGFWDTYLEESIREIFYKKNNYMLELEALKKLQSERKNDYLIKISKFKASKLKKKKSDDGSVQLSLF